MDIHGIASIHKCLLVLALVLGAVALAISGHNPLTTCKLLATESFGSMKRVGATPLIFTGFAMAMRVRPSSRA